jgi:hypothetical protein
LCDRLELRQQLALLHPLSLKDVHSREIAFDASAHVHALERAEQSGYRDTVRERAHMRDRYVGWRDRDTAVLGSGFSSGFSSRRATRIDCLCVSRAVATRREGYGRAEGGRREREISDP